MKIPFFYRPFLAGSQLARLIDHYGTSGEPEGVKRTRQTIRIGRVRWRSCVAVCISEEGLYVSVEPPLCTLPAILLPWGEIKTVQATRLYSLKAMRLSIGDPEVATVSVYMNVFEMMEPYLNPGAPDHPPSGNTG